MTTLEPQSTNPMGLTDAEMPMYRLFLQTEGKEPESMWQLMCYSIAIQEGNKRARAFWNGVFGL